MIYISDILLHMQDLIEELQTTGCSPEAEVSARASYSCLREAVMKTRCADLYTMENNE
jgi:hypothetical protein